MEFALLVIGGIVFMSAINNTTGALFSAIKEDVGGSSGFIVWAGLLAVIGIGGRITGLTGAARMLMTVLIVVYVVKNPKAITSIREQIGGAAPSTETQGNAPSDAGTASAAKQ